MSEEQNFQDLLRRIRAREAEAAAELIRQYEPTIRRIIRVRLVDGRLRRVFDSMDICQSVLASFFTRAALGQYHLDTPEQLLRLLSTMARNKLFHQVAHKQAGRRDIRLLADGAPDVDRFAGTTPDPGQRLAAQELLDEVRRRFSPEERQLLDLRDQGHAWAAIAAQLGASPEALRKRWARAVDRVARQMDL